MTTGIRNPAALGRIVTAMRALEGTWVGSSPDQRAQAIADAVVAELLLIGVVAPTLQVGNYPGLSGEFDFEQWTLKVNSSLVADKPTDTATTRVSKISNLGDTIAHEARHCEQWFRMGRLLATQRRDKGMLVDGREITNRLGIDNAPAAAASAAAPTVVGAERQEAEEWYGSVYGSQSSFREQTYALELNRSGNDGGRDWQRSQYTRYQRALAEEEDAWGLGTELQTLYLQHHPGVLPPTLSGHTPVRQGVTTY